jgi:DNA-binding NarL/FixJ family response regulator
VDTDHPIQQKRVLIVEDHPLVADATRALLSKMDITLSVSICNCAQSALSELRRSGPWHRIFLDLDVPGAHGLSLVRQFAGLGMAPRCAVITSFNNAEWRRETKAMGVLGYIVKATPVEEFAAALQTILEGRSAYPQAELDEPHAVRLTRRQHDVLDLLQRGYSSKEIASQLGLNTGTVDNHVGGLLRALGVSNRTHAIAKAMELGYLQVKNLKRDVKSYNA